MGKNTGGKDDKAPTTGAGSPTKRDDKLTGALVLYAYQLGGNTREIARRTGLDRDVVATALFRAAHLEALASAGITEEEWRSLNKS